MPYETLNTKSYSVGSAASNSASLESESKLNRLVHPMYSVPHPNYISSLPPHPPSNFMSVVPDQQTNILVPPYPPPFPPPFRFQHKSASTSDTRHLTESFSSPYQSHLNIPSNTSCLETNTTDNYPKGGTFSSILNSNNDLNQDSNSCTSDELWIRRWHSSKNIQEQKEGTKPSIKIHQVKERFKKCLELLHDLEKLNEKLIKGHKDVDEVVWRNLTTEFLRRQEQVTNNISSLPNFKDLKKVIVKRLKKRKGQKSRRRERKERKLENQEKRLQLHHQIDTWLQDMQKAIDKEKREESLKKEADSVLSDVIRKKSEGNRQLALVTNLVKLRQLRAKSAANKGLHVSVDDGIRFTKVAEHLKELWEKQLEEYNVEEQGMRVMLSEAVDERDQSRVTRERQVMALWKKLLFGQEEPTFPEFYLAADKSGEAFIAIRQAWDRYLASQDVPVQSNIPIGWVLPCSATSPQWENFLLSKKDS